MTEVAERSRCVTMVSLLTQVGFLCVVDDALGVFQKDTSISSVRFFYSLSRSALRVWSLHYSTSSRLRDLMLAMMHR